MTTLQRLVHWKDAGAITGEQYNAISAIVRKDRFSVFLELNALLYLGVLSLIAGIGWVIQAYVASLGDAAIISALTAILLACCYYCFSRSPAYSSGQVESPTLAFDYVLYMGCLTFGIEIERLGVAIVFTCAFLLVRPKRIFWGEDFPGDDYGVLQAVAWAGMYATINLQLTDS